jgi:4-hydroxy-3-methylbut-2-enyl diphosphate reductase
LNTGEKVTGVVQSISPTEVSVDLGTKYSGYIPISELTDDPDQKPEDIVTIGGDIEAFVMRVNDIEGTIMLSKNALIL